MKAGRIRRCIDDALEHLSTQLDRGMSEQLKAHLAAMGRFHRYSFGNVFLIISTRPDATQVAGYRTWRRLGRRVKRGERGIPILAPIVYWGNRGKGDEQSTKAEVEIVRTFKVAYVFDVSQTEGKELPKPTQTGGNPGVALEQLKSLIASEGIKLGHLPAFTAAEGVSRGGEILIRRGLPLAAEFSVLVHELAHELLHAGRQERPAKTVLETEAEAVAFVVCQAIGLETNTASSDYVVQRVMWRPRVNWPDRGIAPIVSRCS